MAGLGIKYKRRSLASAYNIPVITLGENDDEAEMSIRRSSLCNIKTEQGAEIQDAGNAGHQMRHCIKMSIENKINAKNAFQMKLIDFLVDALKKHDPNMDNFQVASASLDASAKIYGFRVDKVHTDLMKLLGISMNKRKRTNEDGDNEDEQSDTDQRPVRKKKRRHQSEIISTVEALKSKLHLSNPLPYPFNCSVETLTSDMLLMACLPQHVNRENALSLFNYVILDRVSTINGESMNKISIKKIDNFTRQSLCPVFSNFRFLGWSPKNDHGYSYGQEYTTVESESEYDFHLDDDRSSVGGIGNANSRVEDDFVENNMDDVEDEINIIRQSQKKNNSQDEEAREKIFYNFVRPDLEDNVVSDFMEIIASANPEAAFEYSYTHRSMVRWNGPSYWRLKANKNAEKRSIVTSSRKKIVKKNKKDIVLSYTVDFKEKIEKCFESNRKGTTLKNSSEWKERDKCNMYIVYNPNRFYNYFTKIMENQENNSDEFNANDVNYNSDFLHHYSNDIEENNNRFYNDSDEEEFLSSSTQVKRAKKFNMHKIKNSMWKIVAGLSEENKKTTTADNQKTFSSIEPKIFSDICSELPKNLSTVDASAFNSSIAFVALMHLANEKHLMIEQEESLSDLLVTSKECN